VFSPPIMTKSRTFQRTRNGSPRIGRLVSRKRKRTKKKPLGREALRDVQERAVPRPTQYSSDEKRIDKIRKSVRSKVKTPAANESLLIVPPEFVYKSPTFWLVLVALFSSVIYGFWETLTQLELTWRNQPDYSHGYLIVPLALILLWSRRETFPGIRANVDWWGLSLICLSVGMRVLGSLAYMDFLDGYAIVPLLGGITWVL